MTEEVFDAGSTPEFTTIAEPIRDRPDLPPRVIVAAAQLLNGRKIVRQTNRKNNGKGLPWQTASWEYYDEIGEFSWAVELLATHVSKVRLVAARDVAGVDEPVILDGQPYEVDGEEVQPTKIEQDAAALIAGFAGGTSGQQQLLYRAAVQLIVAAESYIVGRQDSEGEPKWDAYSNEEIQSAANGTWKINDGTETYTLKDEDILIRVWRPHPRKRSEPRSSSKPLLPVLAEIKGLTQAIGARIDSRLAGAGVLFIPESAAMMTSPSADLQEGEDPFVAELIDAMLTPIKDRDSAAAVVPIVVRVPDEAIGKIQHVRFEVTTKAEEAMQRMDAIGRMATAVDVPREQVTGLGDINHWGSWQADEATVKGPVATLDAIIVHALTIGYLRPGLEELGHSVEDITNLLTWYDLTALIQRPDRSEQALQAFDRDAIGYTALLRESGFDEADSPTEEDTCRKTFLSMMRSDPGNARTWIAVFGPCSGLNLGELPSALLEVERVPVNGDEPPEVADDIQNNRDLPELQAAVTAPCPDNVECLYGTCEMAVLRALELAGKRMRGSSPRNERSGLLTIPAHELHTNAIVASQLTKHGMETLLDDAWTPLRVTLPEREALVADLDGYVRLLIEKRQPHDPSWLRPIVARHA